MLLKRYFNTLFGRLFTGFCLIIIVTAVGVRMVSYTTQIQRNTELGISEWRFIARKSVDCALGIYDFGGREALIRWLKKLNSTIVPVSILLTQMVLSIPVKKCLLTPRLREGIAF